AAVPARGQLQESAGRAHRAVGRHSVRFDGPRLRSVAAPVQESGRAQLARAIGRHDVHGTRRHPVQRAAQRRHPGPRGHAAGPHPRADQRAAQRAPTVEPHRRIATRIPGRDGALHRHVPLQRRPAVGAVNRIVAIVGPTATGKSALGIAVAAAFDGEVLACDSTAVYRGIDIGTDKVPVDAQHGIAHHLVDLVDATEVFDAARYAAEAARVARAVVARGRLPVLVGGTGFYYRALMRGLFPGPTRDAAL